MYLLDTNVVSELRKGRSKTAHPGVVGWAGSVSTSLLFLSTISVLEFEHGVLLVERRDPAQGAKLREWLDHQVTPGFEGRILSIDAQVARVCAALHVPNPRPDRDAMIAATALVHGMTVVTRNIRDFRAFGVPVLDPWSADSA